MHTGNPKYGVDDVCTYLYHVPHRRRKMLKLRGAKKIVAHKANAKISRPRPLLVKPRPFPRDLARPP